MVGEWQGVAAATPHNFPISTRAETPASSTSGKLAFGNMVERGVNLFLAVGQREPGLHSVESAVRRRARAAGQRSEWTMPLPAVIRLTAPGSITAWMPRLSRCSIAPSNK